MTAATALLRESLDHLERCWSSATDGPGTPSELSAVPDAGLLALTEAVARLRRHVDSVSARIAAEVSYRSRAELGKEGLARKTGHRTPAKLIATATGGHVGDAARLIQVGEATAERCTFEGESAPARHPAIATALAGGRISVDAAAAIAAMLDRIAVRVDPERLAAAERALVGQASLLSLNELAAVLRRAEAVLNPEGLDEAVAGMRGERSLRISHDRFGMTVLTGRLDPETAAPIVAAIQAIVTHQLRTSRGRNRWGDSGGEPADQSVAEGGADSRGAEPVPPVAEETRSVLQLQADALASLCRHALGCAAGDLPLAATTVVVRMTLDQLTGAAGPATIDGLEQPIDAATARRMAATAEIMPCVLGGDGEVLDFGRAKRLFTRAQRLALVERDGGCAFCHLPPGYTEAHHLTPWEDGGVTDLREGILLCTACHHRVHDDGWTIRIEPPPGGDATAGTVWFIPPAVLDPYRTPRLGGRRRFDPTHWGLTA